MTSITIFAISGATLIAFITTKILEEKMRKQLFLSTWIRKCDEYTREWYHSGLHWYSAGKDRISFFINKEVKLHSKNFLNKLASYLKEKRDQYETNMRNSRLLKKSDGISEFFKSISDVEKGNGSIDESLEDGSQEGK